MITPSVKRLNETKARVAKLERDLAKELASLPSAYGFNSLNSFVAAVAAAAGTSKASGATKAKAAKRRKRAKITDAIRAKVKRLVKSGKTGAHIAKAVGISLPSVQNIKKALGLVRTSKKSPLKRKTPSKPAKRAAVARRRKRKVSPRKTDPVVVKPSTAAVTAAPTPSS